MRGFSNWWNTKQDILASLELFPEQTKEKLQEWLDTKDQWLVVSKLEEDQEGVTDDTHKVVENKDHNDVITDRYQYELKEDPNGPIYRLGLTVSEVKLMVNG